MPDPIRGQSATSLHTDDLFYTATACGCLVFIQPGLLQEPEVCADPFTRCRFVCGMGVTVSALTIKVKCSNNIFVNALTFVLRPIRAGNKKPPQWAVEGVEMEQSAKAKQFLASLDPESLKVGDGSDGLPVWIGIDADAGKVYRVYASGLAQGFGDGHLLIINGLQAGCGWRLARADQSTNGRDIALFGGQGEGGRCFEADPGPTFRATAVEQHP